MTAPLLEVPKTTPYFIITLQTMKKLEKHIEKLTSKKNLLEKLMKESKDPTAQIRFDDAIRFYKEEINELKEIL